jgi:hypothetical protein
MNCVHGINREYCAYCDGSWERNQQKSLDRKFFNKHSGRRLIMAQRRGAQMALQEDSKSKATRDKEPWLESEIRHVICATARLERHDYEQLYQVALEIGRTLGSVQWLWNYIWSDKVTSTFKDGFDNNLWTRVQEVKNRMIEVLA